MINAISDNFHFFSSFIIHDAKLFRDSFTAPFDQLYVINFVIFSIIPILGIASTIHKIVQSENFYFSIFSSIILIVSLLFFATHVSLYWQTKQILFYIGYILFIINTLVFFFRTASLLKKLDTVYLKNLSSKKITSFINYSACKLPELGIIIIPFYFLIMLQNLGMYGYDTFWHGMFSKHINNFGNFWDSESIILQSHMTTLPFFYLFQNFFLTQGEFIERVAVFSNNFFISMGLLAIFSEIKNKFSIRIIAFISVLILYSMFGHGAFMTLTIEHCLSITFAFFMYFFSKKYFNKKILIYLLMLLPLTITMKENFVFLIPTLALMAAFVTKGEIFNKDLIKYNKKYIYIFFTPILGAATVYLFYQSSFDFVNVTRTPFDIFLKSEKLLYIPDVTTRLIKALFINNIVIQGDLNSYLHLFNPFSIFSSWTASSIFFIFIANLSLYFFNKEDPRNKIYIFVLNIGFVFYFIFLLMTFVFGMNQSEASTLSSYERYVSVYIFGSMLFTLIIICNSEIKLANKTKLLLLDRKVSVKVFCFLFIIFSVYLYNGLYSTRMFATMNPDIDFVKREKDSVHNLKNLIEDLDPKNEYKHVVVTFNENIANIKWIVLKYMIAPNHDLKEIKLNSKIEDILPVIESSEILVFDNLNDEQEKKLSSLFRKKNIEKLENRACFISDDKLELRCK